MNELYIYGIYASTLILSSCYKKFQNISKANLILIFLFFLIFITLVYKIHVKYPNLSERLGCYENYNKQPKLSTKETNECLDEIIGLENIKSHVKNVTNEIKVDLLRNKKNDKNSGHHMMFKGNPGTGKTNIARLMGKILYSIGYLKTPNFVEVQRSDLVAEYVGQTCNKTRKIINSAMGGVLFIDEAYRLCPGGTKNTLSSLDFGYEAIDEIMAFMNDYNIVIIFAGYPQEMETFENSNPGLFRRIRHKFDFPDYNSEEITKIFLGQIKNKGYFLNGDNNLNQIRNLISKNVSYEVIKKMNGGLAEQIFMLSKIELNNRIINDVNESIIDEKNLNTFDIEDVEEAILKIKN